MKKKSIIKFAITRIKRMLGWTGAPKIVPFIGYGNKKQTYISGLIVEDNGLAKPIEGQGLGANLKAMFKRYTANELEGVRVSLTYRDMTQFVTTDHYGIYRGYFQHENDVDGEVWQKAKISLPDPVLGNVSMASVESDVMQVPAEVRFGVISDIDDTILVSYATQKLMKLRLMLLNNAYTRMPFEGVSGFYRALQGEQKEGFNPIFYLSNSEWHLYDLLYEFIEFHRIPKGPLLLREMAIKVLRPWKMKEVSKNHKTNMLKHLFSMYGEMSFILIGDSGQKDPEIYLEVLKQFPGRILAIYIRDAGVPEKLARIKTISQRANEEYKTEMLLVKDTGMAMKDAREKGFIGGTSFADHSSK